MPGRFSILEALMILKLIVIGVFVILMSLLGAALVYALIDDKYNEEDKDGKE